MKKIIKKGFTLVELIVVITILTILGTISFISLSRYNFYARDGVRVADLNSISTGLELFYTEKGLYPEPSNAINISYSGTNLWKQGKFDDQLFRMVSKINKKPVDPLSTLEYVYATTYTKSEFQLGAAFESESISYNPIISTANAEFRYAIVKGNYNGKMIGASIGSNYYVFGVPSIITTSITDIDIISLIQQKRLVFNGFSNMPIGFSGTNTTTQGGFNFGNAGSLIVYSGSLTGLGTYTGMLLLAQNLDTHYTGTPVENDSQISPITSLNTQTQKDEAVREIGTAISNHQGSISTIISSDVIALLKGGSSPVLGTNQISMYNTNTCALSGNGGLKCWGAGNYGWLGNGNTVNKNTAVDVTGLTSGIGQIVVGNQHTCALTTVGGVKCWGIGNFGQNGNGLSNNDTTPVDVSGLTSGINQLVVSVNHTCGLTTSGGVKCWGGNSYGQLGDGTTTNRATPVNVSGLTSGVSLIDNANVADNTCAVTTSGGVKCWGGNSYGQLGDGTSIDRSTPVDAVGLTSGVASVKVGWNYTCAVTTTGGVKCWGRNNYGQLGDGSTTDRLTPVDVVGLTSGVSSVKVGQDFTCALTTGGGVKCWGRNFYGTLGDGTSTNRTSPVNVSGLTSGVSQISLGVGHTCALTTSGGVKCWGDNAVGQLGDGTTNYPNSPVNAVGLTSGVISVLVSVDNSCAITSTGGVRCWGYNSAGQIGDGTTTNRSTPTNVLGL